MSRVTSVLPAFAVYPGVEVGVGTVDPVSVTSRLTSPTTVSSIASPTSVVSSSVSTVPPGVLSTSLSSVTSVDYTVAARSPDLPSSSIPVTPNKTGVRVTEGGREIEGQVSEFLSSLEI